MYQQRCRFIKKSTNSDLSHETTNPLQLSIVKILIFDTSRHLMNELNENHAKEHNLESVVAACCPAYFRSLDDNNRSNYRG
jgi:hypothetical protein